MLWRLLEECDEGSLKALEDLHKKMVRRGLKGKLFRLVDHELRKVKTAKLRELKMACEEGHLEKIGELLSEGVEVLDFEGNALRKASEAGFLEVVQLLIEQGADVHVGNNDPLQLACVNGHLDVVKTLVESGADVHANGGRPLWAAASQGHLGIVQYLIGKDARPSDHKYLAFFKAARWGHVSVIKYLFEVAEPPQEVKDRLSYVAASKGYVEVLTLLAKLKVASLQQENLLEAVCLLGDLNTLKVFTTNTPIEFWAQGLRYAIQNGHLPLVVHLVEKGADPRPDWVMEVAQQASRRGVTEYLSMKRELFEDLP